MTPDLERIAIAVEADPAAGIWEALRILRRSRRGFRCVQVFCLAVVGNASGRLQRFPQALRYLRRAEALADGCPCCAPTLARTRAFVACLQENHGEALRLADLAVELAPGRPLPLLVRGHVRIQAVAAGAVAPTGEAFADYREALRHLSPESRRYRVAMFGLAAALAVEGRPEDRDAALAMLPDLRQTFASFPAESVPVAQLDWLAGQLNGAAGRYGDGRELLRRAVRKFYHLDMTREAAGAWTDLVLLEIRADAAGLSGRGEWRTRMLREPRRARVRVPWPTGRFARVPGTDITWREAILHREPVPVHRLRKAAGLGPSLLAGHDPTASRDA